MKTVFLSIIATSLALGATVARADSDLAYYQQFQFQSSTDADGNVSTRFLDSAYSQTSPGFPVGSDAQGNPVFGQVQLFLVQDGSFVLAYTEVNAQGLPITFQFPPDTKFSGSWSVPGQSLLVGDIATGARETDVTGEGVQITFLKDLITPGLAGKSVTFDYAFGNETPTSP